MKLQFRWMAKVLAAPWATVGFLFIVDELVANQARSHGKCHTTLCTLIRPHAAVNGLVLGQVGGLCETLGAHRADIWTHSGVDFLVLRHTTGQGKCLPTVRAGEGPFSKMLSLMTL